MFSNDAEINTELARKVNSFSIDFRHRAIKVILCALLAIGAISITLGSLQTKDFATSIATTSYPTAIPSHVPSSSNDAILADFLITSNISNEFTIPNSPQYEAKRWMTRGDPLLLHPTGDNDDKILQRYALASLYFSLSQEGPSDIDWIEKDECDSIHIACNDDGYVRTIMIDGGVGGGVIPNEIGLLKHLENLSLVNNLLLSSTIPHAIRDNVELRQINLFNNSLSGSITDSIYSLPHLSYINLGSNRFSGVVEGGFGSEMEKIILDKNDFTGPILESFFDLPNLSLLSLSHNRFNSLLMSSTMKDFDSVLEYIYLDNNELNGTLPSLNLMTGLKSLSLSNNSFTGKVSHSIQNLVNLIYLNIANNSFEGYLNSGITDMKNLKYLIASDNKLYGPLDSLGSFPNLEVLSISRNDFHCNSSDSFLASLSSTKISHLSFFESGLNGTMDALCSLEKLEEVFIDNSAKRSKDTCNLLANKEKTIIFIEES